MSFVLPLHAVIEEVDPIAKSFHKLCGGLTREEIIEFASNDEGKEIIAGRDPQKMPNRPSTLCVVDLEVIDGDYAGESIELRVGGNFGSMTITDAKLANYKNSSPLVRIKNLSFTILGMSDLAMCHKEESRSQAELNQAMNRVFDHLTQKIRSSLDNNHLIDH
jgi:hypothetical protein